MIKLSKRSLQNLFESLLFIVTIERKGVAKMAYKTDIEIAQATEKKKIGSIKPFACFIPEVVQFFADDISDPESKFNGLMADIAKELLPEAKRYVYFSTAKKIAAPVHLGCITL